MKRVLPVLLVLVLLLCACGTPEPTEPATAPTTAPTAAPTQPPTEPPTVPPTEAPTVPPTEAPTVPPTVAPSEPPSDEPVLYRNPLNGMPLDAPYVGRVFAVTINNVGVALPHRGVSQADVFFEMFINDYSTRGLALFSDVKDMESIGSVRSTRYNFTDLALAYNLILCHASASDEVLRDMYNEGVDQMNVDGSIGYRDYDRYKTYAWEHCLFVTGEALIKAAENKGFDLAVADRDYGMQFVADGTPAGGANASEVEIVFTLYGRYKTSKMIYDAASGKYIYHQFSDEEMMVDENNNLPEAFTNVIVILAPTENDGAYHVADLYGEGEGYYACGGKIVKIKWVHAEEEDPFTFFLEDGTPLQQGAGSSYIAIAPTGSPINYK